MISPELKAQQDRDHDAALESAQGLGADILPRRKTAEEMAAIQAELKVQQDKEFAWANEMNKTISEHDRAKAAAEKAKFSGQFDDETIADEIDDIEKPDDQNQEDTRQAA